MWKCKFVAILALLAIVLPISSFAATIVASRTSGVAPLAVHFYDSVRTVPSDGALSDFHSDELWWDFGDPTAGTWGTDGASRNSAKGPIAAHVFETPGTYTVSFDGSEETITVADPDTYYAGTNTVCISTDTDFEGCPDGAVQVTTSDISDLSAYSGNGVRTLFHRGSSWTISSNIVWGVFGDTDYDKTVGAYGACTSPNEQGICSNAPIINVTHSSGYFMAANYKKQTRVMDLHFVGLGSDINNNSRVIDGDRNIKDLLVLRVEGEQIHYGIATTSYRSNDEDYPDKFFVVDSWFHNTYQHPTFIGGERLGIMGNVFADSTISHSFRLWQSYIGVVSHNKMYGAAEGRHCIKLHGPYDARMIDDDDNEDTPEVYDGTSEVGTFAETGAYGIRNRTEFNIVSDNLVGAGPQWIVSIGPESASWDERVTDLVFERNKVFSEYDPNGVAIANEAQVGIMAETRYCTFRGNIVDGSGSANGFKGIYITQRGIEPAPEYNEVYDNVVYRRDSASDNNYGIGASATATNTLITGNYIAFPNVTGEKGAVLDVSGVSTVSGNTYTDNPAFVDPDNADPLLRVYLLDASAYTITASRVGGVAPLAVHFYSPESLVDSETLGHRSVFHTLDYTWTFDDSEAGTWVTGEDKNTEYGPVSAHVFDSSGSYTVTLTVKNSEGTVVGSDTETITVIDPDTYYANSATTCVNPIGDSDFSGCPDGATQVNEDDPASWGEYTGAGERLLFKRGSTWTLTVKPPFTSNDGPVTVGAYGTGERPHFLIGALDTFLNVEWKNDWRVVGLHITGGGVAGVDAFSGKFESHHCLVYQNEVDGCDYGLTQGSYRTADGDDNKKAECFIIENTVAPGINVGIYTGGESHAIMGNTLSGGGQHTLRVIYAYLGVISHNLLSGAGHNATGATDYGGHTLKFHGPHEDNIGPYSEVGSNAVDHRSQFNIISFNVFGGAGDYQATVAPQSTAADHNEQIRDILVRSNRFLADFGLQNKNIVIGLWAAGAYFSIENNIFDAAGTTGGYRGVRLTNNQYGLSGHHYLSNNTIYRGDELSIPWDEFGVLIDSANVQVTVKNTLASFPHSTGNQMAVSDDSGSATLINNILNNAQRFVDPDNINPLNRNFSLDAARKRYRVQGALIISPPQD